MSRQFPSIFGNQVIVLPPPLPCPGVNQNSFIPQRSPRKTGSAADFFLFWGFLSKDFLKLCCGVSGMLGFFSPFYPCPSAPYRNFSSKIHRNPGLKNEPRIKVSCKIMGKTPSIFALFYFILVLFFISVALLMLREEQKSARSSSPLD